MPISALLSLTSEPGAGVPHPVLRSIGDVILRYWNGVIDPSQQVRTSLTKAFSHSFISRGLLSLQLLSTALPSH